MTEQQIEEGDACEEKYCGFLCEEVTEKQQAISDEINDLEKVNPQFAKEFREQMVAILFKSKI